MKERREKGKGSISQRKDGTWTARIDLGKTIDGKRKIKAFYGKTEKEVKNKINDLQKENAKYSPENFSKLSISELLIYWQMNIKRYELKPTSFDGLEQTINNNIIPYIGYKQVSSITPQEVQSYINELTDKGYSYSTIKKAYNALNAVYKMAIERDYIRKNPCVSVRLPKQIQRPKSDIVFFSDDEINIIVNSAIKKYSTGKYMYKHGYAIVLLVNTGMRVGEMLALKWNNVDLNEKQIHVVETRKQIIDRSGGEKKYIMADSSTKTQSSDRYIPINKKAEEALLYFKSLGYNNPYVLANSDYNVITYRNLFRVLSNILKANNINHGSLHTLRHTFATKLFRNGIDVKVISELLGHSDIRVTYDIYTHVINEQKKKAVSVLDNL